MNTTAHNILNAIFVLLSLYSVWRFHTAAHWLAILHIPLLFIISLISALTYSHSLFAWAQLAAWTTFLHFPLLLIGYAVIFSKQWPTHPKRRPLAIGSALWAIVMVSIAIDAFFIEPHWLETSYVTLTTSKLSTPLRVAVIADIQTDRPGDYEKNSLRQALAAEPDIVLFAGDYIHLGQHSRSYAAESAALNAILKQINLTAPLGAYAIRGNVDWPPKWQTIFAGLPISTCDNTAHVDLGPLVLTTLSLEDSFSGRLPIAAQDKFQIVIGHSPNFSLGPVQADLLIAGHTHGGQVQLPLIGPLLTLSDVPRAWASGVTEIAPGKTLIVSRGIGMERGAAPRLRFLCRPEIVIIDIVPVD